MSLRGPLATSAAVSSGSPACPNPFLLLTLAALRRTPRERLTRASTTSGSGAHRSASMRAARVCEKYLAPISSVIYMLKPHPSSTPLLLTFPLTCPLASNPSCTAQDCPLPHLRRTGAGAVGTSMEGQLAGRGPRRPRRRALLHARARSARRRSSRTDVWYRVQHMGGEASVKATEVLTISATRKPNPLCHR